MSLAELDSPDGWDSVEGAEEVDGLAPPRVVHQRSSSLISPTSGLPAITEHPTTPPPASPPAQPSSVQ